MSLYAERGGFDVFTPESHVPLDIVRRRARSPFDDRGGGQDSKKRAERGSEEDLDKHHPSRSWFCAATLVYTVIPDLSYEIFTRAATLASAGPRAAGRTPIPRHWGAKENRARGSHEIGREIGGIASVREPRPASSLVYTSRLCAFAAAMKLANSG